MHKDVEYSASILEQKSVEYYNKLKSLLDEQGKRLLFKYSYILYSLYNNKNTDTVLTPSETENHHIKPQQTA